MAAVAAAGERDFVAEVFRQYIAEKSSTETPPADRQKPANVILRIVSLPSPP